MSKFILKTKRTYSLWRHKGIRSVWWTMIDFYILKYKYRPIQFDLPQGNLGSIGFFSVINNLINVYALAKDNKCSFTVNTAKELAYYNKGFHYYFEPMVINSEDTPRIKAVLLNKMFGPVHTYGRTAPFFQITFDKKRLITNNIIKYTPVVKKKMDYIIKDLNIPEDYVAIHIRRGDKLIREAKRYEVDEYFAKLNIKEVETVFIMTHDYEAVIEAEKYIQSNSLNIKIYTLCPPSSDGYVASVMRLHNAILASDKVVRLLTEVEIAKNSEYFIGTMRSNVGRYIKLTHKNPNNCISLDQKWNSF